MNHMKWSPTVLLSIQSYHRKPILRIIGMLGMLIIAIGAYTVLLLVA